MVAQKKTKCRERGGKDNGGKSSFKSAGPDKRGPYRAVVRRAVADGGRPCGLFNGARARLRQIRAVCGGRRGGSAVFDHGAVILGGAVGYLFRRPWISHARCIAALLAVGAIRWSLSELKSIRDHPVFAPVTAFLPLLSDGHRHGVFKRLAFKCALPCTLRSRFWRRARRISSPHRAALETHRETAVFDSGDVAACYRLARRFAALVFQT